VDAATADRLERLTGVRVADCRPLGGQHGVLHYRVRLGDSRVGFAKVAASPAGLTNPGFPAEAAGLNWLAAAGAVPVPGVLGHDDEALVIDWIETGHPDRAAAARFGRELAALHAAGADRFGAPWPGAIAGLPLPNGPVPGGPVPGGPTAAPAAPAPAAPQ
jgi:fructosamine-3-kinase